ncbi:MAG: hypothetical protein FWC47_08215, partial [Oscillospiraceae bacterium]|nr:hypothetical protein [Oscillospiraceae bacterium]
MDKKHKKNIGNFLLLLIFIEIFIVNTQKLEVKASIPPSTINVTFDTNGGDPLSTSSIIVKYLNQYGP